VALVRAVVVSWQGVDLLPACLDSLQGQNLASDELEIVVVDNASTDGTDLLLAQRYPGVRVLVSEHNLGFPAGANLGMEGFTGDFLVLLNNDATLDPTALQQLLTELRRPGAERVGAATAQIRLAGSYRLAADGETPAFRADRAWVRCADDAAGAVALINSTGNVVRRDGAAQDRDWLTPVGTGSTDPDVFGFCGGAALLRRRALDEVGRFDGALFLYYEDTDLSWRLRAHGWSVRYVPGAVAHHRHATSSGVASPLFRYHNTRNSLIVATRHAPWTVPVSSFARQTAGWAKAALTTGLGAGPTRARGRALRDYLGRLPRTLAERRSLWAGTPVTRREVARWLQ
jgi:N-acetylglucosaminyl-diphospho-decaprenol L-rhamnosyltransferase